MTSTAADPWVGQEYAAVTRHLCIYFLQGLEEQPQSEQNPCSSKVVTVLELKMDLGPDMDCDLDPNFPKMQRGGDDLARHSDPLNMRGSRKSRSELPKWGSVQVGGLVGSSSTLQFYGGTG